MARVNPAVEHLERTVGTLRAQIERMRKDPGDVPMHACGHSCACAARLEALETAERENVILVLRLSQRIALLRDTLTAIRDGKGFGPDLATEALRPTDSVSNSKTSGPSLEIPRGCGDDAAASVTHPLADRAPGESAPARVPVTVREPCSVCKGTGANQRDGWEQLPRIDCVRCLGRGYFDRLDPRPTSDGKDIDVREQCAMLCEYYAKQYESGSMAPSVAPRKVATFIREGSTLAPYQRPNDLKASCAQCGSSDAPYVESRCVLHYGGQTEIRPTNEALPALWQTTEAKVRQLLDAYGPDAAIITKLVDGAVLETIKACEAAHAAGIPWRDIDPDRPPAPRPETAKVCSYCAAHIDLNDL